MELFTTEEHRIVELVENCEPPGFQLSVLPELFENCLRKEILETCFMESAQDSVIGHVKWLVMPIKPVNYWLKCWAGIKTCSSRIPNDIAFGFEGCLRNRPELVGNEGEIAHGYKVPLEGEVGERQREHPARVRWLLFESAALLIRQWCEAALEVMEVWNWDSLYRQSWMFWLPHDDRLVRVSTCAIDLEMAEIYLEISFSDGDWSEASMRSPLGIIAVRSPVAQSC